MPNEDVKGLIETVGPVIEMAIQRSQQTKDRNAKVDLVICAGVMQKMLSRLSAQEDGGDKTLVHEPSLVSPQTPEPSQLLWHRALADHWLWEVVCDHEAKTDVARCACGVWKSQPMQTVAHAVECWIEHVELQARALAEKTGDGSSLPPPPSPPLSQLLALSEALRPFAVLTFVTDTPGDTVIEAPFFACDFRRAHEAYQALRSLAEKKEPSDE